jgi:hypothetical protein
MSQPNRTKIPAQCTSTETTSDDGDTRLAQQRQRRIANRRDRHNTNRQLHVTVSQPIRKLLASV